MNEIFVPLFSWLLGGSRIGGGYNTYSASRGTDPSKGCLSKRIFNYRIWIEKLDERELLKAAVYYGTNSFESLGEDDFEVVVFDAEEESRENVRQWLEEKYNAYLASEE